MGKCTTISFRIFRSMRRRSQFVTGTDKERKISWIEARQVRRLRWTSCAAMERKIDSARLSFSSRISCDRSSNSHLRPLPPSPSHPPTYPPSTRLSTYPPRRLQTRSITVFARRLRRGKIVRKPRIIHQSNAVLVDLARKIRRPPFSPRELDAMKVLSLTLSIPCTIRSLRR